MEGVKKNKARVVSNGQVTRSTVRWAKEPDLPSADNGEPLRIFSPTERQPHLHLDRLALASVWGGTGMQPYGMLQGRRAEVI